MNTYVCSRFPPQQAPPSDGVPQDAQGMDGWTDRWMDGAGGPGGRRGQTLHRSGPPSPHSTHLPDFIVMLSAASLTGSAGSRQILPFLLN